MATKIKKKLYNITTTEVTKYKSDYGLIFDKKEDAEEDDRKRKEESDLEAKYIINENQWGEEWIYVCNESRQLNYKHGVNLKELEDGWYRIYCELDYSEAQNHTYTFVPLKEITEYIKNLETKLPEKLLTDKKKK